MTMKMKISGGNENSLVFVAAAVAVGAKVVDRDGAANVPRKGKDAVERKADSNRRRHLDGDYLHHKRGRHLLRNKNWNELVGSREKHGNERADGHYATRVERRGRGRYAALRNRAGESTSERPYRLRPLKTALQGAARVGLDRLEHKVGHEEKRQKQKSLFYEVDHVANIIPNKRTHPHGRAILGIVFKDICSAASEGSSSGTLGEYAVSPRSGLRSTAEQQRERHRAFGRYRTFSRP